MPYPVQKFSRVFSEFCVVNETFTHEEIDKILDIEDLSRFNKGRVGTDASLSKKERNSDIFWIVPENIMSDNSEWLFQKFSNIVSYVNYDHFMYDITHFDAFQYTKYSSKDKQHYDWHVDEGGNTFYSSVRRKMSASIMLSDPDEYEGGEFHCILNGKVQEPVVLKPKKGDAIFFPSNIPHKVAPVTSGVRRSLVVWVLGPR